jgi:hypothetical protein
MPIVLIQFLPDLDDLPLTPDLPLAVFCAGATNQMHKLPTGQRLTWLVPTRMIFSIHVAQASASISRRASSFSYVAAEA